MPISALHRSDPLSRWGVVPASAKNSRCGGSRAPERTLTYDGFVIGVERLLRVMVAICFAVGFDKMQEFNSPLAGNRAGLADYFVGPSKSKVNETKQGPPQLG